MDTQFIMDIANANNRMFQKGVEEGKKIAYREIDIDIKDMIKYAKHIHKNNQVDDSCAICGYDLRHSIHLRVGEKL